MEPSLSGAAKRSSEAAPAASEQPPEPTPGPLPGPPPLPDCLQEAALVHLVERGAALTGVATQAVGAALVLVATSKRHAGGGSSAARSRQGTTRAPGPMSC